MGKTLFVSDFDDTLARTDAKVILVRNGERTEMDPAAFAIYEPEKGDTFDFSQFDKLINPRPIQRFVKLLKQAIGRADKIAILTARGHTRPVAQFLKMHGIDAGVSIAAIGSADPEKKASYIRKHIQAGFDRVAFIDDSPKNIAAVERLRTEFPKAKILAHQAKEEEEHPTDEPKSANKPTLDSPEMSAIAQQAKQMGLTDFRFGRYGKDGKVTHIIKNGRLVPKPKGA
jgi:hypothetical protein